jgi:transmembrane protein 18
MLMAKSRKPESFTEHWEAFVAAVNWREHWIVGLLSFHLVYFLFVLYARKNISVQACLFVLICILVALTESLNKWANANWRVFSGQNYFDHHGAFAVTMFSGPLLFIGLVQLVSNYIYLTVNRGAFV